MRWLHREKIQSEAANESAPSAGADAESSKHQARQRHEAEAHMILSRLNNRMKFFRPMIERVLGQIEGQVEVVVVHPQNVTYGDGDAYFPTYEWKIYPKKTLSDLRPDPRNVTLQLRASLGRDLTAILVYYLLSYEDSSGDEHPIHQQPTDIYNETLIRELLLDGITRAGLLSDPNV
jgi:hypothetical protein